MPVPHSYDLRVRAMAHYKQHGSATPTSEVFKISRFIIYDWKRREAATGDIQAKAGYQKGYGTRVKDLAALRQVAAYPPAKRIDLDESGIASREVYPYSLSLRSLGFVRFSASRD